MAGGLLLILSAIFSYVPIGGDVGEAQSCQRRLFYLLVYGALFGMTLFEIPHVPWASELALTSADKAKIFSFRSVAGMLVWCAFILVPLLPFFDTQDITPETLKVSVMSAVGL